MLLFFAWILIGQDVPQVPPEAGVWLERYGALAILGVYFLYVQPSMHKKSIDNMMAIAQMFQSASMKLRRVHQQEHAQEMEEIGQIRTALPTVCRYHPPPDERVKVQG